MCVPLTIAAGFAGDEPLWQQLARFFAELVDNRIVTTDLVVWGAVLLGVTCGLLGCFVILRRQSLLGDAIGHAVLPGVCLGFLFAGGRSGPAMFIGALIVGLIAAGLISLLQRTTTLKTGECIGAVAFGFYALGIVLLRYIQKLDGPENFVSRSLRWFGIEARGVSGGQSGLDKFLFGQIVAINKADVLTMAIIAAVVVTVVWAFWRPLAASTFDEGFSFSIGLPVRAIHYLMTALLTASIVVSIQAVGVVLVAAMLVTPAATAYLLTDRLHRMAALSAVFGAAAGVLGAFFSLFGQDLPTGAFMVLGASSLFAAAFLLSPRHGLLPRLLRLAERRRRTQAENLLRTLYILTEKHGAGGASPQPRQFKVDDVAAARNETPVHIRRLWKLAASRGWVDPAHRDPIALTDAGFEEARRVVRNHRLWELFLTQEAHLAADHVHRDAEEIEHVLPRDVLRRLEQMLDHPTLDPHGRPIP